MDEQVADKILNESEETPEAVETEPSDDPLQAQLETLTSALQRERADFINYKKRVERDNEHLRHKIAGDILKKFLPITDDFERAMELVPADQQDSDWMKGISMIWRKLASVLEAEGIVAIIPLGEPFDPNYHEAIGTDEATPEIPSQHVSAVLQRGYRQGERVLRPAIVRVAD